MSRYIISRFFKKALNTTAQPHGQDGFTLVEIIATISLMTILVGMATGGLSAFFSRKGLETSATEVLTEIREVHALAVASGNTYRIDFNSSSSYVVQRRQGETWVTIKGPIDLESDTTISGTPAPDFGGDKFIECYARGTCEDGQLVLRDGKGGNKTIHVYGETVNIEIN
jgi:prepilin-type N-terminal cleavage/methylation domain-containing protein